MIQVQSEMHAKGYQISITKLCRLFGIKRRSFYYKPITKTQKLNQDRVEKLKEAMERFPSYGYRRLALVLGMNKKAVQRILQIKGWQVKKRSKGHRPRAKTIPSRSSFPNQRWAIEASKTINVEEMPIHSLYKGQLGVALMAAEITNQSSYSMPFFGNEY